MGTQVTKKDIAIFCRQFYFVNDAGIPITKALDIIQMQLPHKRLKAVIGGVRDAVLNGESIASSLRRFKEFPDLLVSMTEVGELSGQLSFVYEKMAAYYEKEYKAEQDLKGAMIYPSAVCCMLFFVIAIAIVYLVPNYASIYQENYAKLPLPTEILIGVSSFVSKHFVKILFLVLVAIVGLITFFSTPRGKYLWGGMLLRIPILGPAYLKSINLRFAEVMCILLDAAYPIKGSLLTVKQVINNTYLNTALDGIIVKVDNGISLGQAVEAAGFFEPIMSSMIKIGEESGNINGVLVKCTQYFEMELNAQITRLSKLIEPLMILAIGLVLGFIMLAIMMPAFNLGNIL